MSWHLPRGNVKFIMGITDTKTWHNWIGSQEKIIGIAMVGRSNVGKSSLINALFGKGLARTSKTPGRTRQINVFEFKLKDDSGNEFEEMSFYLFDLPGYGYANISKTMAKEWRILMDGFFTDIEHQACCLINIQDARHPMEKADLAFLDIANYTTSDFYLVFNKIDKLKTQKERSKLLKIQKNLSPQLKGAKQFHSVSAEKATGIKALEMSLVNFLLEQNHST
ncbi:MAG: ribosome biogenesis GTP-binding protein YihA/YsxC [Bacteriovoracia bacterium]